VAELFFVIGAEAVVLSDTCKTSTKFTVPVPPHKPLFSGIHEIVLPFEAVVLPINYSVDGEDPA
jgi:hypothetical protein